MNNSNNKEYRRKYYLEHLEERQKYNREYYQKNRLKIKNKSKRWQQSNVEKVKEIQNKYWRNKILKEIEKDYISKKELGVRIKEYKCFKWHCKNDEYWANIIIKGLEALLEEDVIITLK